ncbi:MAG: hypothetical protein GY759_18780 [Chloroflexi bacterium]|nr:hypothetical protein [Chloroflexota bacterium]
MYTKLYVPLTRSNVIPRPRLIDKLNLGLEGKLTLISAPAGYGKTTLLTDWCSQTKREFAWVSLDEDDNDLARLFTYVAAAVQQIEGVGNALQGLLQSPQPAPAKSLATTFINDCTTITAPFVLILDDYHTITGQAVNQAIAFLVDNIPPHLHLVIASRTDPLLPLSRLRARGQMAELRTDDLRFTAMETASFLHQLMGLNLSVGDLSALEARTEGWIAGLQMAGLSIQGLKTDDEIAAFVAAFTGSHRYIFDYLTDEVIRIQPSGTEDFLLLSSILDRFNGPLCNAVTEVENSQTILEKLDAANLFVIPLDNERRWYRYHHLFADLLHHRLQASYPDKVAQLHHRASLWHEENDMPVEAIRHALSGQDWHRAARLVEQNGPAWLARSQLGILLRWLSPLPESLIQARPNLGLLQGWAMALINQFDRVEPALQAAEAAFQAALSQPAMLHDLGLNRPEEQARLHGYIAVCRGALARSQGDFQQSIIFLRHALDLFSGDDLAGRSVAELYLGYALWMSGDLPAARHAFIQARQTSLAGDQLLTFVSAMDALGKILLEIGELRQADALHQQALTLAEAQTLQSGRQSPSVGLAHNGLACLLYERNELETATIHANSAVEVFKPWGVTENLLDSYDVLARIMLAQGNVSSTLSLAQTAASLVQTSNVPDWLHAMILARQARLRILAEKIQPGQLMTVAGWAAAAGLDPTDDVSYQREFEYILLARLLQAEEKPDQALALLNRLAQQAENSARTERVIEILILKAISLDYVGKRKQALSALEQALVLAEPQGYLRIFVDEGSPIVHLLTRAARHGVAPRYVSQILKAYPETATSKTAVRQPPLHSLSERELDVLQLLPSGQTGPQIAEKLYISNNTVKTHLKNIYSKLNVTNRAEAIARAQALGLLH